MRALKRLAHYSRIEISTRVSFVLFPMDPELRTAVRVNFSELHNGEDPQNSLLLEETLVDCGCMKCPQCLRRKGRCFPIEGVCIE